LHSPNIACYRLFKRTAFENNRARFSRNRKCTAALVACLPGLYLVFAVIVCAMLLAPFASGKEKDHPTYGAGLIVNIPLPESEVEQVVGDIAANGIIRGTKEYNKDEFVTGAKPANSSPVFDGWEQDGKVFYKVRTEALDPRNFKDSNDVGTLAVRYLVKVQDANHTILRIDALFQEDFRRAIHQSNGSVENAEFKDIQEHLEAIEVMKKQDAEIQKERLAAKQKKQSPASSATTAFGESSSQEEEEPTVEAAAPARVTVQPTVPPSPTNVALAAGETLQQHVEDLRRQVERVVKAPGAPLKSAPFHTASTLQSLASGTEVLILITTPYWYGVETHDGQHGWIMRDDLEQQ
jgi:hypothetical protein